ncbi:MAG: electron transport complex subunit RsxC [Treponema sp.]|jgi:electron transport complex protein RnfC|nr:electron transport complex subunit RsxC [Treponema sp.]
MVNTFKRGLKLPTRKHATEGKPVELVPSPRQVYIPVNQHFGAPNTCLVKTGDTVKRGQKIADGASPGPMTVPVHASISGVVKKIEMRTQSNNTEGLCVLIEAQEGDRTADTLETEYMPPLDPFSCSREDALARIREAGIQGMGGAGFPSHVKLSPPPGKAIDIIIADGAECEPYLTTDEAVMTEKPHLLIRGLAIVMQITGVKKAIIGMEDNKENLIPLMEREIRLNEQIQSGGLDIGIGLCRTLYPQGGEKMLITALTGREVPSGGLPMDAGCIVQNVGTLIAIAEAFSLGKPLIDRDLTVSGGACRTPKNIRAPIGVLLSQLPVEFMDIDTERLAKIIFGGPMMGNAVPSLDIPVQKNTSGIILMTAQETAVDAEGPCIRCSRCIRNCPCRLSPVIMNNSLDSEDLDYAVKAGLLDCIECGSCTYVCPARIKLVQRFRVGKQRLRARQALEKAAASMAVKV